jgi:choline monooxygenase
VKLVESLPASAYCDADEYQVERQRVFRPAWVLFAYSHQFTQPGDYVADVIAEFPIFVQLGDDRQLRGFHNVCAHRAGPIMWDGEGRQSNLVCRYHGWAYTQDGQLRNARDFGAEDVGAENPTCLSLSSVRVQTWRGMIFVCMDHETPDLVDWLRDFPKECVEYPIESYVFHSRTVKHMDCNWKTYADNFLEGYHVPLVHPGLNREVEGLTYRVITRCDRRWNLHVAEQRRDESAFTGVFLWFWPNFSLNIFQGGFAVERWLPRGHDKCDLVFEYFFEPNHPTADEIVIASEAVGVEDVSIAEGVQRNLRAGIYVSGLLSPRHENGLADFKELLAEAFAGEPLRP